MENTHTLLVSLWENTIEPDDVIRHVLDYEKVGFDTVPTAEQYRQFLLAYFNENGEFPEDTEPFTLCPRCRELMLFDYDMDIHMHLVPTGCIENRDVEKIVRLVRYGK